VIVRGFEKGRFGFCLVKGPRDGLISVKKGLIVVKMMIRSLYGLIGFLLLLVKEKALYNISLPHHFSCGVF
jgi:hypothetical protein